MSEAIQAIDGASPDFKTELAQKIADLFPEAVSDGKIDIETLRTLLADDAESGSERFGLFWPGKKQALKAAQIPTRATLLPQPAQSKAWDSTRNVFIEGDNLEVLKILQRHYHGKVRLIYIDPPYNTGRDFIYPDNYQDGQSSYLTWTKQVNAEGKKLSTNSDTDGRYHSNWLNMIYPRLKLARNLLTDDGVIFISIDDHEMDNLSRVCNEIFGEDNLLARFPRVTKKAGKSGDLIAQNHDYVLAYARSAGVRLNRFAHTDDGFRYEDEFVATRGKYKLNQTLDYGSIQYSRSLDYEITLDGHVYRPGGVSHAAMLARQARDPRTDFCWRWSKTLFEFGLKNGFIVAKQGRDGPRIYTKTYQNATIKEVSGQYEIVYQERTKAFTTLDFTDNRYSNDNAKKNLNALFKFAAFDYAKPVELVKTIVNLATDPDREDIVLDFFAGSGTTAQAVMQANAEDGGNRRHIQVQLPEPTPADSEARAAGFTTLSAVTRERLRLAGDAISRQAKNAPDTGYRSYQLTDSHFSKWQVSSAAPPDELRQRLLNLRNGINPQATPEAILCEVLLKKGFSLSEQIERVEIAGLQAWAVNGGALLAYLDESITPEAQQLAALVERQPQQLVILEDALHGNDTLKANLIQQCQSHNIALWTA